MSERLPTRLSLKRCQCSHTCRAWLVYEDGIARGDIPLFRHLHIPKRTAWIVATKREYPESFDILPHGGIELLAEYLCTRWRKRIKRYYAAGYRYVHVEYEE